jgi:hypothetical protein
VIEVQSFLEKIKQERQKDKLLAYIHHRLMSEYGWIPLEEFKQLPIPTVISLLNVIREEKEAEKKEMDKAKGRSRMRRR